MRATIRLLGRSLHLPTVSPTEAANPMRACSETYLLTDFEKSGGTFKNIVQNLKNTDEN